MSVCLVFAVAACAPAEDEAAVAAELVRPSARGGSPLQGLDPEDRPSLDEHPYYGVLLDVAPRAPALEATVDDVVRLGGPGLEVTHRFRYAPGFGARMSVETAARVAADPRVRAVDPAPGGSGGIGEALELAGFAELEAAGLDGNGGTVAVIDSGADSDHPDLAGALIEEACFCSGGCCPDGSARQSGPGSAEDDHGHGTWTSGIVASRGEQAEPGAAPGSSIVAIKMLDGDNRFQTTLTLVEVLEYLLDREEPVDAANLSLGTDRLASGDCDDASATHTMLAMLLDMNRARGTVFTASSMNDGSPTAIATPACLSGVLAVGAVHDAGGARGMVSSYSNASPSLALLAAGDSITSSARGGGVTANLSGTSFAAPQVAACAAILATAMGPRPNAETLESVLLASPQRVLDSRNAMSFPLLDCAHAFSQIAPLPDAGPPPDAGPMPDAGMPRDAGPLPIRDASARRDVGPGVGPPVDDGCGCRAIGAAPAHSGAWTWALVLALLAQRRRRR